MAEQRVRLVLLGGASAAPVCDGDVCYLPGSTATTDPLDVPLDGDEPSDHDAETEHDQRVV
jgi:hypothetical protein